MITKNKAIYLLKDIVKSPCRAAYINAKLPVKLEELDTLFGSFAQFFKELQQYKKQGSINAD